MSPERKMKFECCHNLVWYGMEVKVLSLPHHQHQKKTQDNSDEGTG